MYYGDPVYPWTFSSTQTEITARRVQAAQALLDALCMLPERDQAKIRGVTLLGELHHLFPDFQAGMGFSFPYRVTDYSPASVAGFQRYLQAQFGHIAAQPGTGFALCGLRRCAAAFARHTHRTAAALHRAH